MGNKIKKEEKAITLIALVITIIVLIILAGVAISMISGENGIIKKAIEAKQKAEEQEILEKIQLAVLAAMGSGNGDIDEEVLKAELTNFFGENGYEISDDKNKITVGNITYEIDGAVVGGITGEPDVPTEGGNETGEPDVPSEGGDGGNNTLQQTIAKHINTLGDDVLASQYNTANRECTIKVNTDLKIKEADTSNDYGDGVLRKSETYETALSDTFSYQGYLFVDNLKQVFTAYKNAAKEYGAVSPIIEQNLNNVAVSGEFYIDIYYPSTFEIADLDDYTNANGYMYGFGEGNNDIFFDTERFITENVLTNYVTVNSSTQEITYNKLTIKVEVKGLYSDPNEGKSLTYEEFNEYLDNFNDINFTVPYVTQTLDEDTPIGYYYYSVAVKMNGYIDIGLGRDGQGLRYSRIYCESQQQEGTENNASDENIGENLLDISDITSTFFYMIRNRSGGGY